MKTDIPFLQIDRPASGRPRAQRLAWLLGLFAVLAGLAPAAAQPTAITVPVGFFSFNFPAGVNLPGQIEPNGVVWASAGPSGSAVAIAAGSLVIPDLEPAQGNRARLAGINGPGARVALDTNVSSGSVFYSLALRVAELGNLGPAGATVAALNDAVGASAPLPAPLAARLLVRSATGGYQVGLSKTSTNSGDFVWMPPNFTSNDVVFVVLRYTFVAGQSNDVAAIWVNPPASTFDAGDAPSPGASTSAGPDIPEIRSFVLLQRPALPAVTFVDEVRVGTAWAIVTPPPRDWGDAPDTYHTLGASNGPRHRIRNGWRLGALVDPDTNGAPSANSDGDDVADGTDDEDGVTFPSPIIPGLMASNGVAITVPAGSNAYLNVWYDFNRDGAFAGAVEHVVTDLPVTTGTVTPSFMVPLGALAGSTHARFRLSAVPGLTPEGPTSAGEVEDYGVECKAMDFGDLPDGYRTTKSVDGARHLTGQQFYLGSNVDTEDDGVPSGTASGDDAAMPLGFDDETGVSIPTLVPGFTSNITVTATTISGMPAYLDGWIDWNRDGIFDEVAEKVFASVGVVNGANTLPCPVPASALPGSSYARFRLSLTGGLSSFGYAGSGEVEDYQVNIGTSVSVGLVVVATPTTVTEGDAVTFNLTVSNHASQAASGVMVSSVWPQGFQFQNANASQGTCSNTGAGLVCNLSTLQPQGFATVAVTGFYDWDWWWLTEPSAATNGFAVSANGIELTPADNLASAVVGVVLKRDWGDAPDTYHTLAASSGPRHRIRNGWRLGALVDPDPNGMPSANSDGDDTGDGNDDEDGVTFLAPIIPGLMTSNAIAITVPAGSNAYLNVWCDFNRNGVFAGAVEHVITDLPVTSGVTTQSFLVPLGALAGSTHARFRLSTVAGLSPEGPASAGEVEDYGIECKAMDFGDLPDTYRTTKSVDGARNLTGAQFYLGSNVDTEDDGVPSGTAQGDDAAMPLGFDDETGVSIPALVPGFTTNITVFATTIFGTPAYLDAWMDWNRDGDFNDAGEQIFTSVPVSNGANTLPCPVPVSAVPGSTYARFRLSLTGGLASFGYAGSGEVEDYTATIGAAVPVVFGGLLHSPLGGGVLTVLSNQLQVANLGASGQDGVRIALGESDGWRGTLRHRLGANERADGSRIEWTVLGDKNGDTNQPVIYGRVERSQDALAVYADASLVGGTGFAVEVLSNGVVVANAMLSNGRLAYLRAPGGGPLPGEDSLVVTWQGPRGPGGPLCDMWWRLDPQNPLVCDVVIDTVPPILISGSDTLRIRALNPTATMGSFSRAEFRGANSGDFSLRAEAVVLAGHWQEFLANAVLQAWPDDWEMPWLQAGNFGASGQDGLLTELGAAAALDVSLQLAVFGSPGGSLRITPVGTAAGLQGPLASVEVATGQNGSQMAVNLALPGNWHFDAWELTQQVVHQFPQASGAALALAPEGGGTVELEYFGAFKDAQSRLVVELEFAQPILVTPVGGASVRVTRMRCTTAATIEGLGAVRQNWAGFASIIIGLLGRDYGDAPTGYPVTSGENGASHRRGDSLILGTRWDREFNGSHSANSDYDDTHGIFGLPIGSDDEDGVVFIATTGTITVHVTAQHDGYLDAWMDFNRDSDWADAGEQVFTSEPLTAGVTRTLYISVPPCVDAGQFVSRWRLSSAGGLSYTGYGGKGEVEDYVCNWQPEGVAQLDFGDVPEAGTTFPVTLARDGARHGPSTLHLGNNWDGEPDGQPGAGAVLDDNTGVPDDEDGIAFPAGGFVPGAVATVQVTVTGGAGMLDAWFDWNNNLNWDGPERSVAGFAVTPGLNFVPVSVPAGIPTGGRYVRFRLSTLGSTLTTGCAADGEVEDYTVTVSPGGGGNNPNLVVAAHSSPVVVTENLATTLTLSVSNQGPAAATGVQLTVNLPAGLSAQSANSSAGNCQVTGSNVVCSAASVSSNGSFTVQLTVLAAALDGSANEFENLADLSCLVSSTEPDVNPADNARAVPVIVFVRLDFGDAPDPTYPTLRASNGARHRPSALFLGAGVDVELNGLPSPLASGDDTIGADDEDGVVLPAFFPIGGVANVTVTASLAGILDVWADFNGDGDWFDAGEHVIIGAGLPAGPGVIAIPVPAWTVAGNCFLRFRLSPVGAPAPTGFINGGEVEDHVVETHAPAPPGPTGTVRVRTEGGRLRISWDRPNALLQAAPALDGPWATLIEAEDSFEADPDTEQRFFRVVEGRNASRSGLGRRTLGSMVREADLIVDAVVTDVTYMNSSGDGTNSASWPHTFVTVQVLDTLKGRLVSSNLCLRFLGGLDADGDRVLQVSHSTQFDAGERSILFVRRNTFVARPLVGGSEGRLRVVNGLVYSEHGHRMVLTDSQRLAFGMREELEEVHQDVIGSNVVGRAHSDPQGEAPPPQPPTGQHLGVAAFKAALSQIIQLQHTPTELQNPVLTLSADCVRLFDLPLPRHRTPPLQRPAPVQPVADDEETARVKANGGNPVLPPR